MIPGLAAESLTSAQLFCSGNSIPRKSRSKHRQSPSPLSGLFQRLLITV